jgi:HD-like signal output (HDOD) protein
MSLSDRYPFADLNSLTRTVVWPVMPEAGQALIQTLNDDKADTFAICRIIKKDPTLTASLLRMANSAMFGLSGQVDTLERAVSVVGLSMVRTRALSLCMAHASEFPFGVDRMAFWHYSLRCACYAQWLADLCDVDDQEAWLCGMMLRLGGLSVVQAHPELARSLETHSLASAERWQVQRRLVGFDEGEVTAELAQHWDLPLPLVLGLRHCAQPLAQADHSRLAAVLHLAARLADSGSVTPRSISQLPTLLMQTLALDNLTLLTNQPDTAAMADVSMFGA